MSQITGSNIIEHLNVSSLLTTQVIEENEELFPEWAQSVFKSFKSTLSAENATFPCTFGVEALKKGNLRFTFIEDPLDEKKLYALRDTLCRYMQMYRRFGRITSMVAFFQPGEQSLSIQDYNRQFWNILQFLHDHDTHFWPPEMPVETAHPLWEFCFCGEPMFVVCNTPVHINRKSRKSESLVITFQPRWVFEGLGYQTEQGKAARAIIREHLIHYDNISPYPTLGGYGDENNHEWMQYFLPDNNEQDVGQCPLNIRHNTSQQ